MGVGRHYAFGCNYSGSRGRGGGGGGGSGMLDNCTAVYEAISACILCWQWSNKLLQFVSCPQFGLLYACIMLGGSWWSWQWSNKLLHFVSFWLKL